MSKPKVLYVEDEIFLARIVRDTLQDSGYEVVVEHDGANALQQFRNTRPDICILDIMLPNRDGFSIADEIRSEDSRVPIVFLSAKSQGSDVVAGFRSGGNDYIRKPFSMEELIARMENLLQPRNGEPSAQEPVRIGSFSFDPVRQTLENGQQQKKLSYRESELLRLLYANREKVVERSEILTLLWGSDSFFNSRNLDVYITRLRNLLKPDPAIQIITIKGVGYKFVAG